METSVLLQETIAQGHSWTCRCVCVRACGLLGRLVAWSHDASVREYNICLLCARILAHGLLQLELRIKEKWDGNRWVHEVASAWWSMRCRLAAASSRRALS